MEITLRTLHPTDRSEFFAYCRNPSADLVEQTLSNPVLHYGQGQLGDVSLNCDGSRPSSVSFYLGLPDRALVVFRPHSDGEIKDFVRVCEQRDDAFVVVPDMAADEYYNVPHKMLIPLAEAIDSAKRFLASDGTSFAPDNQIEPFSLRWIRWYEIDECMDPFMGAIQQNIDSNTKPNKSVLGKTDPQVG